MESVGTPTNADAGPSQPKPSDPQPTNITVLANRRFPVPPSYYTEFTSERWKRYKLSAGEGTISGKGKQKAEDGGVDDQRPDDDDGMMDTKPSAPAQNDPNLDGQTIFQPPRIDWIKREDSWDAFGRVYQRRPKAMTAEELGIPNFKPQDTEISDKQYMHLLLRSIIHTKLKLLEAYTKSVRPTYVLEQHFGIPHEGEHYVQHISNLAATMLTIANGLRETQARLTLELTMRRQIERRQDQTRLLKEKCQEMAARLTRLQTEVQGDAAHEGAVDAASEQMDVS